MLAAPGPTAASGLNEPRGSWWAQVISWRRPPSLGFEPLPRFVPMHSLGLVSTLPGPCATQDAFPSGCQDHCWSLAPVHVWSLTSFPEPVWVRHSLVASTELASAIV